MSNVAQSLKTGSRPLSPSVLKGAEDEDALERLESLQAAFSFFNETSSQLAESYKHLESRVSKLSTELQQAQTEKALEKRAKTQIANRMQALMEFLPGGVIVLDSKGIVIESNPAARSLLQQKLNGCLWREVITECFSPRNDDGFEVSTRDGKRISIATESLENQGQIILLTDQTETRKLQQNLYRQQRLSSMGKMVSALAHQIRTPLSAAILYAGHLVKGGISENQQKTFSRKVLGRLKHMESQVRDMMLFVRSELPLNDVISTTDLELGLREAMDAPLFTSKSVCHWDNQCPTDYIRCNREALISALMNLVMNGLEAAGEKTELHIRVTQKYLNRMPQIEIAISDRGPGMSPSLLKEVKELFVTTKPQGTGLGLAVVLSVARAHGGDFRLESEPGKGTEAILILPLEKTSPGTD